jgi:hypothetical protein
MISLAFIGGLGSVYAFAHLWLLAVASQVEIQKQFPSYAEAIFRPGHQVVVRQGGPVRAFKLLTLAPPGQASSTILLMRCLALIAYALGAAAIVLWLVA